MKSKLKTFFSETNEFLRTDKVVIIFLLSIANNIYGVIGIDIKPYYIDKIQTFLTSPYYLIILLLIMLISVFTTVYQFEKNHFFIIRCKGREEYLNKLIIKVCQNIAIIFTINLIIALIMMNMSWNGSFGLHQHEWYNINNLQYLIFYLFRMFIIIELLSVFSVLIIKTLGNYIAWVINIFAILLVLFPFRTSVTIQSIISLPVLYISYLDIYYYESFNLELVCSIIFLGLSFAILKQLKKLSLKIMHTAGE